MPYSEEEFKKLLDALSSDLLDAGHHFRLYRNLRNSLEEYSREINQCVAFWGLTLNAHREVSILHLCRAYDNNNQKSLSLKQFLQLIQENPEVFDISKFCERLKDNPYVDSLVQNRIIPKKEAIEQDLQFVSNNSNPLVKKLTILRSNFIAHQNIKNILEEKDDPDPLTWGEFEQLIEKGLEIFNKYRSLFDASRHSLQLISGENHYKTVLQYIRIGMKAINFRNEMQSKQDLSTIGIKAIEFSQEIGQDLSNF
jgi:hypothetical protein